jgi:AraC-like DNA-binding protein
MAAFNAINLRSKDLGEVTAQVATVFCPHRIVLGRKESLVSEAGLKVDCFGSLSRVDLWYAAAVQISPDPFKDFYLITTATSGQAAIRRARQEVQLRTGATVALSPTGQHLMEFDEQFRQRSVRVPRKDLHRLFALWTGRPVDSAIDFSLRPLDRTTAAQWDQAINLLSGDRAAAPLPPLALARLTEFALALLIEGHPHSQTDALTPERTAQPGLLRRAREFIHAHLEDPIGLSDIAEAAGCSIRSLQSAFRLALNTTPHTYLTDQRLDRAHAALCCPGPSTTVANVAIDHGFSNLGRFSAAFCVRFGEQPATLLRQSRRNKV